MKGMISTIIICATILCVYVMEVSRPSQQEIDAVESMCADRIFELNAAHKASVAYADRQIMLLEELGWQLAYRGYTYGLSGMLWEEAEALIKKSLKGEDK